MRLFHLTDAKNLPSIAQNGLQPHVPYLGHHRDMVQEYFGETKATYFTIESNHLLKHLRDFIYWNTMHKPVSLALDKLPPQHFWDYYSEITREELNLQITDKQFILLYCTSTHLDRYNHFIHTQYSSQRFYGTMHQEYCHDDKPIIITPEHIPPIYISVIGEGSITFGKQNGITVRHKFHRKPLKIREV